MVPSLETTKADLLETPSKPIKSSYRTPYSLETLLLKSLKSGKFKPSLMAMASWEKGLSTLIPKT